MEGRWTLWIGADGEPVKFGATRHAGVYREVPVVPCDDVHAWLTRMRDTADRHHPAWVAIDWLIGDWERRASLAPVHDRSAGEDT